MTRDEIALQLIVTELAHQDRKVCLSDPLQKVWTTFPPPALYSLVDNALWVADALLRPPADQEPKP